jgi:hypothetical protein
MLIFFVLNGAAAVFMLYALANFLLEGMRTEPRSGPSRTLRSLLVGRPLVRVITAPLGSVASRPGKGTMIQFPVLEAHPHGDPSSGAAVRATGHSAARKYSVR